MDTGADTLKQTRLVVFSDDWGRHPSSCQHLVGHLLGRYPTLWVNTIGTRKPKLSWEDVHKAAGKVRQWLTPSRDRRALAYNPSVISPLMVPGFRRNWQRRLNSRLITRSVRRARGDQPHGRAVALTTIPVTADLVGRLPVDRWVYYCVDDFSVWPRLDGEVMDAMERKLVAQVDAIVVVSETLGRRIAQMGRDSTLITHGINQAHWTGKPLAALPPWWPADSGPVLLFWGVVDQRLDYAWCSALAQHCGTLVLVGPQQSPDARLSALQRVIMPGPVPYAHLPLLAEAADVLVMPYADLPVTRAIQPLKFKEYLATGKPVVVRKLPATDAWEDTADAVETIEQLLKVVTQRLEHGATPMQVQARSRLTQESWQHKAKLLEQVLLGV